MSSIHLPALHMSNIIAADAPFTSPLSESLPVPWDRDPALAALYDPFSLPAPSVMPGALPDTRKVLKGRMTPDVPSEQCLPTHQVFDFVPGSAPTPMQMSSPASTPESSPQTAPQSLPGSQHTFSAADSSDGVVVVPAKRPSMSAPAGSTTKKARSGERVSTKDFVPPDVSGLSKREARLVKNRAAAFLSRQRKREEFENMEIRVAELEQENANLKASIQQKQHTPPPVDDSLKSELEQLRRQLAETQQRERELAEKLSSTPAPAPAQTEVKMETVEPQLPVSLRAHKGERSGASFGLMVLLCALPTLLSMPTHNAMPSSVAFNPSHSHSHSSSLDMATFPTSDYDFGFGFGTGAMDLDLAPSSLTLEESAEPEFKKLELVDLDTDKFGMSGLDISFDASAAKDGRIRVRIHPPPASENGSEHGQIKEIEEDQTMWHDAQDDLGPFLGVGSNEPVLFGSSGVHSLDFGFSSSSYSSASSPLASSPTSSFFPSMPSPSATPNEYEFELGSDYGSVGSGMSRAGSPGAGSTFGSGRRRVRIALRGMPGKGKEGGEWEVEVC
ncbi:hypothetical protein L226DRAFT_576686 [Lentinus tigrinus ALCF2SS1-7]|uniref:BZIP domain-containing protein n=1 Tax=Lentinus tigrinus ALCF2SS1-6 TaxID=1328759 RepID=A0A5C2RP45_9APHY|nr:hypothetical protein L227DRAFT_617455 [Lentinus tigrinus ALCF2SS1-6]RPD68122.1 hypothetical protein L226DRAFT_576686 [Lentinus tigrinus ALCF2SS1-7]